MKLTEIQIDGEMLKKDTWRDHVDNGVGCLADLWGSGDIWGLEPCALMSLRGMEDRRERAEPRTDRRKPNIQYLCTYTQNNVHHLLELPVVFKNVKHRHQESVFTAILFG